MEWLRWVFHAGVLRRIGRLRNIFGWCIAGSRRQISVLFVQQNIECSTGLKLPLEKDGALSRKMTEHQGIALQ
jgi:hypothetical protein